MGMSYNTSCGLPKKLALNTSRNQRDWQMVYYVVSNDDDGVQMEMLCACRIL